MSRLLVLCCLAVWLISAGCRSGKELVIMDNEDPATIHWTQADTFDKRELAFKIGAVEVMSDSISIEVKYGGGCVKPHEFELVTNGTVSKDGQLEIWLLHKTLNDRCRALIMQRKTFNIGGLLNGANYSGFLLNNKVSVEDKK